MTEAVFIAAWMVARKKAEALGVRLRPITEDAAMAAAHRGLSGSCNSDGFAQLTTLGRLDLSLEALAIDRRYTVLFSDDEANAALSRLLEAGYRF